MVVRQLASWLTSCSSSENVNTGDIKLTDSLTSQLCTCQFVWIFFGWTSLLWYVCEHQAMKGARRAKNRSIWDDTFKRNRAAKSAKSNRSRSNLFVWQIVSSRVYWLSHVWSKCFRIFLLVELTKNIVVFPDDCCSRTHQQNGWDGDPFAGWIWWISSQKLHWVLCLNVSGWWTHKWLANSDCQF